LPDTELPPLSEKPANLRSFFVMDAQAVEQAKGRLQRAERSLDRLKAATNYDEAEEVWSDFLLAAATIYTKLQQGSKSNGTSSGWFGRKKKERREDPLKSEASNHTPSLADFTTTTPELKFSVHTPP